MVSHSNQVFRGRETMKISLLLSIFATGFSVAAVSSPSTPATTTLRNDKTTSSSSPSEVQVQDLESFPYYNQLLIFPNFLNLIKVRKCCPDGERLDSSDPTAPRCVQRSSSSQEMNIVGLDLTKDPGSRRVNLTLTFDPDLNSGMPECKRVFSVLTENSWLTAKGNLVQDSQVCSFVDE